MLGAAQFWFNLPVWLCRAAAEFLHLVMCRKQLSAPQLAEVEQICCAASFILIRTWRASADGCRKWSFFGLCCCLLQGMGLLSPPGPTPAQRWMMEERLWLQAAPCSPSPAAELRVPTEPEGHKAAAVSAWGGRRGSSQAWRCQSCRCVVWMSCMLLPPCLCPVCVSTCGVLRVAASSCHRDALLPGKLGQFQG